MNSLLIITNRGVKRKNAKGPKMFTNTLSNKISYATGKLNEHDPEKGSFGLQLTKQAAATEWLRQASATSKKPWVFFLHGNNQSLKKNLKKCRLMMIEHDVNVIAFSWPSAQTKEGKWLGILQLAQLSKIPLTLLRNKLKQYKKAVRNGKASINPLQQSFRFVREHYTAGQPLNLLCHSMGNMVISHAIQNCKWNADEMDDTGALFQNIVFHQGDVEAEGHLQWSQSLKQGEEVYITHNRKDKALFSSDMIHGAPLKHSRLGNFAHQPNEGGPTYLNFTGQKDLYSSHTIFLTRGDENEGVATCFKDLFSGSTPSHP